LRGNAEEFGLSGCVGICVGLFIQNQQNDTKYDSINNLFLQCF
jgi:hypothetical protein